MKTLPALLVAGSVGLSMTRRRGRWAAATTVTLIHPVVAASGGLALAAVAGRRRLRERRRDREAAAADVAVLAQLVGLALSAGLTLTRALAAARPFVHPTLGREVDDVLRRATHGGLGQALAGAGGHGRRLYVVAAGAVVTGAPLAATVDAFVSEAVAEQRSARLQAARRLPVRLMLPLALLILPGFVLLTVGPTVLAALERFVLPQ